MDEGISDIAKDSHFIINPSKASQEQALLHPITKTIEKFVPDAKLLEQRGESEIVYILPTRLVLLIWEWYWRFKRGNQFISKGND